MTNKVHLIDAGNGVIKVDTAEDHLHLTVLTQSYHDEGDINAPAESAMAYMDADSVSKLIEALQTFKPAVKLKSVDKH